MGFCAHFAPKFCFQLWALSMKREPRNEKTQYDHFTLMVQGLDFGLNRLNEFELAACLDDICPCAQRHSVEYLKHEVRHLSAKPPAQSSG